MRHKIEVTQSDISKGTRLTPTRCPIAQALIRSGYHNPRVGDIDVDINQGGVVLLPRSASRFIQRYDQRKPVKPFNFFLEVPE